MSSLEFEKQIVFLSVSDFDISSQFYGKILGLKMARDQVACRIYLLSGSSYIGICKGLPPCMPNGLTLTLVADDVDGWYNQLRAKGVKIRSPPKLNEKYKIYHFYLKDPDGYTIEIQKFIEPLT